MRYLLALILSMFTAGAAAAPFVEADVIASVVQCGVLLDNNAKVLVPASSLKCRYDLAQLPVGSHVVKMTAITDNDPIWGSQESAESAPLNFTKPSPPVAPSLPRLTL
jgi:hypothetical protein